MKIKTEPIIRETILYVAVGGCTTICDWGVYGLLRWLGVDYRPSTVAAFCAAIMFAYAANKLLVFKSKRDSKRELFAEFVSFVAGRLATGFAGLFLMMFLVEICGVKNDFLAKLAVSAFSLSANYIAGKYLVFAHKKDGRAGHEK